jgi:hypothetical protein
MKKYRRIICLLFFALGVYSRSFAQEGHPALAEQYYPLAQGNSWKYKVIDVLKEKSSAVEWRVTKADKTKEGTVYQIWPTPSDSDDEAMRLLISPQGIVESSSGDLILKFPAITGARWESTKVTHRAFHILSAGQACHAGSIASDDCLAIEDQSDSLRFRTITTYAKGIGPIRYEYYWKNSTWKNSTSAKPIQVVELQSFHVAPQ